MSASMFLAVAAGGALGAVIRHAVSLGVGTGLFGMPGPLATLVVNVAGSAIMGGLAGLVAAGLPLPETLRGFVAVGFLGALTTFSSFTLDAGALMARQGAPMSLLYVVLSVALSLGAFFAVQGLVTAALARVP